MTGTRTEYVVIAEQWAKGWQLGIQGVGATQSHALDDAEYMARDLIARRLDVPADSFDVVIRPQLGGECLSGDAADDLKDIERRRPRRTRGASRFLGVIRNLGAGSHTHTRSGR